MRNIMETRSSCSQNALRRENPGTWDFKARVPPKVQALEKPGYVFKKISKDVIDLQTTGDIPQSTPKNWASIGIFELHQYAIRRCMDINKRKIYFHHDWKMIRPKRIRCYWKHRIRILTSAREWGERSNVLERELREIAI